MKKDGGGGLSNCSPPRYPFWVTGGNLQRCRVMGPTSWNYGGVTGTLCVVSPPSPSIADSASSVVFSGACKKARRIRKLDNEREQKVKASAGQESLLRWLGRAECVISSGPLNRFHLLPGAATDGGGQGGVRGGGRPSDEGRRSR